MKLKTQLQALTLALICAIAPFALGSPMEDEEKTIIVIPSRETGIHPRMAELMGWAIGQDEELTVLRGLQDTAELKIAALTDKIIGLLDDKRPLVQTTAIQTLGVLDAKSAADKLLKLVELTSYEPRQLEQVQMADELLARWKDARGMAPWTARVATATAPMPLRVSAAHALGSTAADAKATQVLLLTTVNPAEAMPLRLAAARSFGAAVREKLEPYAQQLIPQGTHGRLFAALVLRHHSGEKALGILTQLANDPEPAVQRVAMERLLETEPQRLWPTADKLITSYDPQVRLLAVKASKPWHDPKPVALLGATLDDPHPEVRNEARIVLQHLAQTHADLNEPTKNVLRQWLVTAVAERKPLAEYESAESPDLAPHWRAAEQAALLSGVLDDKATNPSLLKMLAPDAEHPRLEVRLATADAIRRLHVPESRAPMVDLMKRLIDRMTARAKKSKADQDAAPAGTTARFVSQEPDSELLAEVGQMMGVWLVAEADPLCRQLIPKHPPSNANPRARASAIWTLGLLHAGTGEKEVALAGQLIERLFDQNPLDPEAQAVRLHSCITVGRMKTLSQKDLIQNRYDNDGMEIKAAARWAIHEMTGEWLPALTIEPGIRSDGFIQPIE